MLTPEKVECFQNCELTKALPGGKAKRIIKIDIVALYMT
jgi:hypothetical protein